MSQPPPMPEPLTAEAIPMAYALPDTSDIRPGAVTTIGVMSIVFAVIQAGVAAVVGLMAFSLYILSIVPPTQPFTPTVATSNWPDGLPIARAAMLTNRTAEICKLTAARRASLDALMRQSGRDVAPTMLTGDITTATVTRLIVSHAKTSDGHDLILVPAGRIELSDTDATFEPEGSTDVVTVETAKMGLNVVLPSATPTGKPVNAIPKVNVGALSMFNWFATSIASGLLSILLLIAGIMTLRGSKGGRRAHLWWAWLKLPNAIAGAAGVAWMFYKFAEVGSASSGSNPADAWGVAIGYGVIQGLLSVGYIAAVIIVMHVPRVRAWFETR